MASRLSEDHLRGVYDTGHQALPMRTVTPELAPPAVDLDALLLAEDPVEAVQSVAPQVLYHALVEKGPEDALEVLELISEEQFTRILDYDAWSEDTVVPVKMIRWLDLFKEISPEQLYRRFRDLEEEYQIALLGPIIDVIDEEQYEKLVDVRQDEFHRLPCGTLFYRIKSGDPRVSGFVEQLVEATLAHDLNYAYALLTHAAFMPPAESEANVARFRRARLEEDGFVTYQEGLRYFAPLDLDGLRRKWEQRGLARRDQTTEAQLWARPAGVRFMDQVLASEVLAAQDREHLTRGYAVLANGLCAATKIESDDTRGLKRLFAQAQALSSLGIEWLARGDVQAGATVLKGESPQILFRTGLSLVHLLTSALSERFVAYGVVDADKIAKNAALHRSGVVLAAFDQVLLPVLGMNRIEILKGAYNRFPVYPEPLHSSKAGTEEAYRMEFSPIDSMAALQRLAQSLNGISGIIYVASLALGGGSLGARPVDTVILRALAHVALGGSFEYAAFDDAAVRRLIDLAHKDVVKALDGVLTGIEETLRQAIVLDADQASKKGWLISGQVVSAAERSTDDVMGELRSLKDQLLMAHKHGHLSELLQETLL